MDLRSRLAVIYSDGGAETDFSADAQDFKRDSFDLTLTTDDFIYIGFRKPINALYAELAIANTVTSSLTLEYFTEDSVWSNLELSDDTRAFTRSGFLSWARPENSAKTTVAGQELHWVRISSNDDIGLTSFQALNLVFSDDNNILDDEPDLVQECFYPQGQTSHILTHLAAKNYIMGRLKTLGYINHTANGEENITEWDVLDIYELRLSSSYYTIAQIYFRLSDSVDDQYWVKYQTYIQRYEEAFNLGALRIDQNDDGQVNPDEKRRIKSIRWVR